MKAGIMPAIHTKLLFLFLVSNWWTSNNQCNILMDQTVKRQRGKIIMPTAYNPPLLYFILMQYYQDIQIDIHETYPKQTWRNRCRIMAANGILDLSIPIEKPACESPVTGNVKTSDHLPWQRNHWRSIYSAYRKSPFFIHYADLFEEKYRLPFSGKLIDWNSGLLQSLIDELQLNCNISYTENFTKMPAEVIDPRIFLTPKNSSGSFIWPEYHQVFGERHGFVSNLSIADLIFNLGPDSMDYLHECIRLNASQLIVG